MQKQIGLAFLGALSLLFGSYGVWALTLAYHAEPLNEWVGKAGLGAGSLALCVLFASCGYQLIRGLVH